MKLIQMTRVVEDSLGDRISDGLVVTNVMIGQRLRLLADRRPLPKAGGLEAASQALLEFLTDRAITLDDSHLINHTLVRERGGDF